MTKRKLLVMIITLVMCVSLCACSGTDEAKSNTATVFTVVERKRLVSDLYQTIMYDPDTMVMYSHIDGSYSGTVSALYNADGTLRLYSNNIETENFIVVAEKNLASEAYQIIMYDPDTMVMYTYFDGTRSGTMSILYNADGTLKLYSPETET